MLAAASWALTLWLGAAPPPLVFTTEVGGVPVGTVELWDAPGRFRYRSAQWFERDGDRRARRREVDFRLTPEGLTRDTGRRPASLWLLHRPPEGCAPVVEELTGRQGEACAERPQGGTTRGRVLGQAFTARYDAEGLLLELALPQARFVRGAPREPLGAVDLFEEGFGVQGAGDRLALAPPSAGVAAPSSPGRAMEASAARILSRQVHASFAERAPGAADFDARGEGASGSCLGHARRLVAAAREQGGDAQLVLGLLCEEDRAWPHAWVAVGVPGGKWLSLDPTTLLEVTPSTHLPLCQGADEACAHTGRLYLELRAGLRRVVRRPR